MWVHVGHPPSPLCALMQTGVVQEGATLCAGMGRGPLPLLEACAPGTPCKPRSSPPSPFVCKGGMQTRDTHTNLDASPLFVCGGDTKQGVWERGGPPPPSACKGSHELKWWHPCEQRAAWKAPFLLSFPPFACKAGGMNRRGALPPVCPPSHCHGLPFSVSTVDQLKQNHLIFIS